MELYLPDLRRGYGELLATVLRHGRRVVSRELPCLEITGVTLRFTDPYAPLLPVGVGRRINVQLAAVEALQLVAGVSRSALVRRAAPRYAEVLVDPDDVDYGAYGPRIAYQLFDAIDLIRLDPGTRRAVLSIWRDGDLTHDGDRPCTLTLQFLIRDGLTLESGFGPTLELHTSMRSQDAWLGVPYDLFMFSQLQHTVARELRVPTGQLVHHVTSFHLYERDVVGANRVVEAARDVDDDLDGLDELPLGVATDDPVPTEFDVAGWLLDYAEGARPVDEASLAPQLNSWYLARMRELLRRVPT